MADKTDGVITWNDEGPCYILAAPDGEKSVHGPIPNNQFGDLLVIFCECCQIQGTFGVFVKRMDGEVARYTTIGALTQQDPALAERLGNFVKESQTAREGRDLKIAGMLN